MQATTTTKTSFLMVFINGYIIQRATNTAAYDGCNSGLQATGWGPTLSTPPWCGLAPPPPPLHCRAAVLHSTSIYPNSFNTLQVQFFMGSWTFNTCFSRHNCFPKVLSHTLQVRFFMNSWFINTWSSRHYCVLKVLSQTLQP